MEMEWNEREKSFWQMGYDEGRDDTLDMLYFVLEYVNEHPGCDVNNPVVQKRILASASKKLKSKPRKKPV